MRYARLVLVATLLASFGRAPASDAEVVPRVNLAECVTQRALDPAGLRGWDACPATFPRPAMPKTGSPLPQCAAVPGVNDRCEKWSAAITQSSSGVVAMAVAPRGGKVFVLGNGVRSDNGAATIVVTAHTTAGKPAWTTRAPTNLPTTGIAIASSRDGRRVYVTGFITLRPNINSFPFDYVYTMALDAASGRVAWVRQYQGIGANSNRGFSAAPSPDGRTVYVTGFAQRLCAVCQVIPADFVTIAYAASNGRPLWLRTYQGLQGGQNVAVSVAVSPNGRQVFVTGLTERPTMQPTQLFDFGTVAYRASDGRPQWVKRYASGTYGVPVRVMPSPRGDAVYVAGTSSDNGPGGATFYNYTVLKYAASNGAQRWRSSFRDVAGTSNVMTAATLDPRGDRVLVTGQAQQRETAVPQEASFASVAQSTVAFATSSGKRLWHAAFAPNGQPALGAAIGVHPRGGTVYVGGVLGVTVPVAGTVGYSVTTAYNAGNGKLGWTARYDLRDPQALGYSTPVGVAADPDGKSVYEAAQASPLTTLAGQGAGGGLLLAYAA